jgi:predicted Holliday junction resolvase-like endonuclease
MFELTLGISALLAVSTGLVAYLYTQLRKLKQQLEDQRIAFEEEKKKVAYQAKKRSGAVQWGKSVEHFAPFIDEFPLPPEDVTFLGMPIDYVGFTDTDSETKCSVHFIEVKSGNSVLSKKQWNIRKAIREGRVQWHEVSVAANPLKQL